MVHFGHALDRKLSGFEGYKCVDLTTFVRIQNPKSTPNDQVLPTITPEITVA